MTEQNICYSRDFVIAGFFIAGFVSTYFTVILLDFSNVLHCNRVFVIAGFVIAGFVIAGFVIAGFVTAGFVTAGFVIAGFVTAGFVIAGCHCNRLSSVYIFLQDMFNCFIIQTTLRQH